MKFTARALLLFSGTISVSARCTFSYMKGAEESELNPHRSRKLQRGDDAARAEAKALRTRHLQRGGDGGRDGGGGGGGRDGGGGGGGGPSPSPPPFPLSDVRSISGTESSGAAHATLMRYSFADYPDVQGEEMKAEPVFPNARAVSNACLWDDGTGGEASGLSDLLWQFG